MMQSQYQPEPARTPSKRDESGAILPANPSVCDWTGGFDEGLDLAILGGNSYLNLLAAVRPNANGLEEFIPISPMAGDRGYARSGPLVNPGAEPLLCIVHDHYFSFKGCNGKGLPPRT
jgi:hypothetical protein